MSTYDKDLLFRVVSINNKCQPSPDWSFETNQQNVLPTADIVTKHVAQFSYDTGLLSATHNFLFAIFFAYRKSRPRNYPLGGVEVEIYFISNEKQYRPPTVQLDLTIASIRQKYLKHRPDCRRFLDYQSANKNFNWAFDMTEEACEVIIPEKIPASRVLGRCTLSDLQNKCGMDWLFDRLRCGDKFRDAIGQWPVHDMEFIQKVASSAKELGQLCEIRETAIDSVTAKTLFDALIDGVNESRKVSLWTPANEVWHAMTKFDGVVNIHEEGEASEAVEGNLVEADDLFNETFSRALQIVG